ncbi:hypothetical protein BKA04_000799 [Cryobacterium mesophilum]|uniref:DUF1697 domain-containing protein n=1 Tax=Terrimesophilobacter mesophilus TaxID=433647 RepID=A0A4R8VBI3_9MICO|nr:hypothetical protein [Terrimesophilobacter mesophilus]MBB5632576.1 hypothetical protein [Terrimesophilobacter mesophilus]TFB79392.1 hypothetical protein E3N84_04600 [Terrimesophilobacter mesophilus]
MLSVAFFRNLNQGQRRSPSSVILERAFVNEGATDVLLVQGNGTVVFSAEDVAVCIRDAAMTVRAASDWDDVVFVRPVDWLAELVRGLDSDVPISANTELSLFDEAVAVAGSIPLPGRRCTIIRGGPGYAVCLNDRERESNGTPTLERMLDVRVTSRGLPTLRRLIRRLQPPRA